MTSPADPPGLGWSDDPRKLARERRKRRIRWGSGALGALLLAAFAWVWFAPCGFGGCAPVSDLERFQAEGSQLLDVNGEPFATLATVNRRVVSIDSLPPYLPQAFLAVEDQRFFEHHGVDWRRVGGAMLSNFRAGGVAEGGSTITMQLARNLFPERLPYRQRSLRRKLLEIRIARQIERALPKRKILELYLNHIYLGDGAYGVDAAAEDYFGKPASRLSVGEAALLGGLPKAPSRLNPRENRQAARQRRDLVLREMASAGYVSGAEATTARATPLRVVRERPADTTTVASYFVDRVRRELEQQVGDRFYTEGLRVYTTLDPIAQAAVVEEVGRQLQRIEAGEFGAFHHPVYAASRGAENGTTRYLQGMATVVDAATGEVRALMGGRDYGDSEFDRATQALRQPGSAFKPFVYLTALERGHPPTERIQDAPVRLALSGGRVWEPRNYTGTYAGPMPMREGLVRSKNTVTVRLAQDLGLPAVIRTARDLGISTDIPDVPSTALGSAAVHPLELVTAYAAFANGGKRVEPHFVRRVEDRRGAVLWEAAVQREQVIDPAAAFVLTRILRDVVNRGTGTGVRAAGFRGPAAGKTGTTNNATDVWFVGYTPELVAGVWIGLDRPKTILRGATGGTLAAPVWGRIMQRIYAGRRMPAEWSPPPGVQSATVDRATGQAIAEGCPARGLTYTEYFVNVAPYSGSCLQADSGAWLAALDTAWVDEEAGASQLPVDDVAAGAGIRWPELEQIREGDTPRAERVPAARPDSPPPPLLGVPLPDSGLRPPPDSSGG